MHVYVHTANYTWKQKESDRINQIKCLCHGWENLHSLTAEFALLG